MTLGFVADVYGLDLAIKITNIIEYDWNRDDRDDKFNHLVE